MTGPFNTHGQPCGAAALVLALALTLLAGCGFQPRGESGGLADLPNPLYISGLRPYSPLHRELSAQLANHGVALSETPDGVARLSVHQHYADSRLLSVDSSNKAVEYELEEALRFSLFDAAQTKQIDEQTVHVLRIQYRPRQAILAAEREAELLRDDMRRELVQKLLQRLAAAR